jgi:hypothetical protein
MSARPSRRGGRILRFRHKEDGTPHSKMHWSQRWLYRKIGESLSFPKIYYSMPINIFHCENHWEPYFTDNLVLSKHMPQNKTLFYGVSHYNLLWWMSFNFN